MYDKQNLSIYSVNTTHLRALEITGDSNLISKSAAA